MFNLGTVKPEQCTLTLKYKPKHTARSVCLWKDGNLHTDDGKPDTERMVFMGFKYELIQSCSDSCNCIFTDLLKDLLNHDVSDKELDEWGGNMEYDDIIEMISVIKRHFEGIMKKKEYEVYIWHWSREEYGMGYSARAWQNSEEIPDASKVMWGYKISKTEEDSVYGGCDVNLYRMTPIVPTKTIETEYCSSSDRTFIIEMTKNGDDLVSEEVIGFYSGIPNEEDTAYYSEHRNLKATYD